MADRVIWKTRVDERTCVVCQGRNNKVFYKDKAPRVPAHDACRCKLVKYQGAAVETVGGAYWKTMFQKAHDLPETVNNGQRLQFRNEIQQLTKAYPCNEVSVNDWMKEHKMEGTSRNDYVNYLCNMKNFVNEKLGKQIYDCSLLTPISMSHNVPTHEETCSKCNAEPGKEEATSEHNPESSTPTSEERSFITPYLMSSESENDKKNGNQIPVKLRSSQQVDLYNAFRDYKVLSTKIIGSLCKSHNIPEPNIIFDKCPDGSDKSCTFSDSIYLNPNTYSPRTILHEFTHYAANYVGNKKLDLNETAVDTLAQKILGVNFGSKLVKNAGPIDPVPRHYVPAVKIRHDNFIPQMSDLQSRASNLLNGWRSRFTLTNAMMKYDPSAAPTTVVVNPSTGQPATAIQQPVGAGSGINVPPPQIIQDPKDDPSTGLLAMFDQMYEPIGNLLGLKARDINESHTPTIISNAVTTLAESNMSDLGSLIVSLVASLMMLTVGVLGKDHIVVGDRKLMAEMGGNFLWNSMRYVGNPKMMDTINDDAKKLGEALGRWNTDQSLHIVTTDSRDNRKHEKLKRFMRDKRGGGMGGGGGFPGPFPGASDGSDVIWSKSGPNGPSESGMSDQEMMMMGMAQHGPMLFTSDGGKPTRILVGADGKTIMKTMNQKKDRGADIRGVIGTTRTENPFNKQSPFTFVGGSGGMGEPDRRPIRKQHTGEYRLDDLEGDFVPAEMEQFYRPQQQFPNVMIT